MPDESTLVHSAAQGKVLHKLPENASSDMEKFIILHTTPDHLFENRRFRCFPDPSAAGKYREQPAAARHSVCPCNAHEIPARAGCLTDTCLPFHRPFRSSAVVNSYLASQLPKKRQRIVHLSKRPTLPLTIFAQRAILLSASNQTPTRYGADAYPQQQKVVHRFIHRLQAWEGDPLLHDSSDHQTRRPSVGL